VQAFFFANNYFFSGGRDLIFREEDRWDIVRKTEAASSLNQLLKLPPDVHEETPKDLIQGTERFIQKQDRVVRLFTS
jgi:hypothetical protein